MSVMQKISLDKLTPSPLNVRQVKAEQGSVKALAASIKAVGLLENLIVVPHEGETAGDVFEVVAGERRLAALKQLAGQGAIPADHLIDCKVIPRADATAASLAENDQREAMHPADQVEAFKRLVDDGMSVTAIGAQFGVSKAVVKERLALAGVAPEVLATYRAGDIDLGQVEAFTLTSDHAKQRELLRGDKTPDAWSIKRSLTEAAVRASDPRARFVGEKDYVAAGGLVRKDLFAQHDATYFEDAGLLERLALEKLEAQTAHFRDEWPWVECYTSLDYKTKGEYAQVPMVSVEPTAEQAAQLKELEAHFNSAQAALDAAHESEDGIDDDVYEGLAEAAEGAEMALDAAREALLRPDAAYADVAGVLATLGYDGSIEVLTGRVRPGDADALRKQGGASGATQKEAASAAFTRDPNGVRLQLSGLRTLVVQDALAGQQQAAMRVLAYVLSNSYMRSYPAAIGDLGLQIRPSFLGDVESPAPEATQEQAVHARIAERDSAVAALLPEDQAERWDWCMHKATGAQVLTVLSYLVARCVDGLLRFPESKDALEPLASALGVDMRKHWSPNASYFAKLKKSEILFILKEQGEDVTDLANLKRGELAIEAARRLADTGWLPPTLR